MSDGEVIELRKLLATEIGRRLPHASDDPAQARSVLHALRGSAAMAGESELALVLNQLGGRLRTGENTATQTVREVLSQAAVRLSAGQSAFATVWPAPPFGLQPLLKPPRVEYLEAMRERISALDALLAAPRLEPRALDEVYRVVHGLKSAASAEGDNVTTWYCHGLEEHILNTRGSAEREKQLLIEAARHRAVLAALLDDPRRALATLARLARTSPDSSPPSSKGQPPPLSEPGQGSLQVPEQALDALLDRLQRLEQVHDDLNRAADLAAQFGARASQQREVLNEALRMIGPPRPWGAPEAALRLVEQVARGLGTSSGWAARGVQAMRLSSERIRTETTSTRGDLTQLRRTSLRWLLGRLESAALELAEQQGKQVRVQLKGGDLPIDRRLAERLLDPTLQLVRNAVTHAFPDNGRGQLWLSASRVGGWLRLSVEDDGRGLDAQGLQALVPGAEGIDAASAALTPFVSTRQHADAFAGRGVGLPMAEAVLAKLGGTLHLTSREPQGACALIELPAESGMIDTLWLTHDEHCFALPVMYARRVVRNSERIGAVSLGRCLGLPPSKKPLLTAIELDIAGLTPVYLAVSRVLPVETVNIHPVPPRIARRGPYSGAVLRRGGQLALVLHGPVVALRAQVVASGSASSIPPSNAQR
ncbi:MAG: ATP-binding protein [Polyangiaceae bacterium]